MSKTGWIVVLCLAMSSVPAAAQGEGEAPQPGPEHERLGYFIGSWTSSGEVKPNPFMPAGEFTNRDKCEWFDGGFSIVCRAEGKGPSGPTRSMGIMGYSTEQGVYTYYGVDNGPMAMTTVPHGKVEGNTWVYHDEGEFNGKTIRSRYTIQETSPTSYTFKWEMQGEDGSWTTVMEGKSTKA